MAPSPDRPVIRVVNDDSGDTGGDQAEQQVCDREYPVGESLGGCLVDRVPHAVLHHRPHHHDKQDPARDHQRALSRQPPG
jgi:hypothetical protein